MLNNNRNSYTFLSIRLCKVKVCWKGTVLDQADQVSSLNLCHGMDLIYDHSNHSPDDFLVLIVTFKLYKNKVLILNFIPN